MRVVIEDPKLLALADKMVSKGVAYIPSEGSWSWPPPVGARRGCSKITDTHRSRRASDRLVVDN